MLMGLDWGLSGIYYKARREPPTNKITGNLQENWCELRQSNESLFSIMILVKMHTNRRGLLVISIEKWGKK